MSCALALVDFDGTLADSMPFWLDLPYAILRQYDLPEPEGFREWIRMRPMWEIALAMTEQHPELAREKPLREYMNDVMLDNYRHRIPLKPGAAEFLALLREEDIPVHILSATPKPYLTLAVEHFALTALTDRIYTEAEVGSKHEADTYRRIAAEHGCALSELLLVEDAPLNILTAAGLGCGTLGVFDRSYADRAAEMRSAAGLYVNALTERDAIRDFLHSL